MAVQIVDPNPDPSSVMHCICRCCGVKLAFTRNDTEEDYTSDYLGDKDWFKYITCPNCHTKVTVTLRW